MKKKLLSVLAVMSLTLGVSALASCDTGTSSPVSSTTSSSTSSQTSSETSSSDTSSDSSSEEVVHVESVSVESAKTTLAIAETTQLTVTVLPANADDKSVTYASSSASIATVSAAGLVTAVAAGTATITVTSTDGAKTATVDITVTPDVAAPTINITGNTTNLTVAAGVDLDLPAFTATNYLGTDIRADVEISDYADGSSIDKASMKFNSKIAGSHTISYYAVEGEGPGALETEKTFTITVTPANVNTFDVGDANDPSAIADYGTFKDGFEDGISSPLYMSLSDSNRSSYLSAAENESIEGNSLVVDFNKLAGNASYSLFMTAFNNHFKRGIPVTYTLEFDYMNLTDGGSYGDCYFGLSWDGSNGINNLMGASGKPVGQVNHVSQTFTEVIMPEVGNAYFFFFKLGVASETKIALDNIEITATECAQTTIVKPTTAQLTADGGFTFDWKERATTISKGETTVVNNIADGDAKAAIQADGEHFGENVMHLTGNDSHLVSGLDDSNLVGGKVITIKFRYYAINDGGLNMIVMVGGAGTTLNSFTTTVVDGNVKDFEWTATLPSGTSAINIYPQNANFSIYVGNMNIALTDPEPIVTPVGETPNGYKVGDQLSVSKREFENGNKSNTSVTATYYAERPGEASTSMPATDVTHIVWSSETSVEWFRNKPVSPNANNFFENGMTYTLTAQYEIKSITGGTFFLNLDNANFINLESSVGYHSISLDITLSRVPDFFSWYTNASACEAYVSNMTFTLKTIA